MKKKIREYLLRLGNNPYVQGIGSIADIFGPKILRQEKSFSDDLKALRNDWLTLEKDIPAWFNGK